MAKFTQENRHVRITTPLGPDKLLVTGMHGSDGISQLFSYELALVSEDHALVFTDIIGKAVTVAVDLPGDKQRYFSGIISRFAQATGERTAADDTTRVARYQATLVPQLWLLTRSAESKIYQDKSVPEIVESVLRDNGINDFEMKLQGSFEKREFCVQYRETHFNFIARLLEDEGIHFFFEHNAKSHRLIIANSSQANAPCPGQPAASYQIIDASSDEDVIVSLDKTQEIRTNKYELSDYNFETPNNSLRSDIPGKYKLAPTDREIYDYPGDYQTKAAGSRIVKLRMEEEETQVTTVHGSGRCRAFTAGYRFTLKNSFRKDMDNKEFILTAVSHSVSQAVQSGADFDYSNHFSCIPADVPCRPLRLTPKPVVQGTQTAIVVGPAGEEIYTDKHGRVKVQFHWDRVGKNDESSSCWIRVAQLWAGLQWGAMYIPRIGHEVIVDFLEGDPDRPIITGRVYHGINMPPYPLPDEKTKSTIKSNSSPGGGGFNEIRFEDKKGEEQVFIHAERQQDNRVKQDSLEWIGNDRHLIVIADQMERVCGDKHLDVIGNQNEMIGGTLSQEAGRDLQQKVGGSFCHEAGMEIHLQAGMKVVIEAGTQISFTVGGSFIDINPSGVYISGPMVFINSGGSAGSGSGAAPEPPKEPKEADKGLTQ